MACSSHHLMCHVYTFTEKVVESDVPQDKRGIQWTFHLWIRGSLPFTQATATCVCDDPYHFNISCVCTFTEEVVESDVPLDKR